MEQKTEKLEQSVIDKLKSIQDVQNNMVIGLGQVAVRRREINKQLEELGLKKGDQICYEPFSEYEFVIEGDLLYRMYTDNITIKL